MTYTIRPAPQPIPMNADWTGSHWLTAETAEIGHFRPESSEHRPQTAARLLHDAQGIHGIFHVQDRFVRCLSTQYMDEVWKDSCVEFFVQPKADKGYFNFEFNCGGAFLVCYITDPTRVPGGFKEFIRLPAEIGTRTRVKSLLPSRIEQEITTPTDWALQFFIPFGVLEEFVGSLGPVAGQRWRGNFFKCADESSHPHWASWNPVDTFNFHLPRCFGELEFAGD